MIKNSYIDNSYRAMVSSTTARPATRTVTVTTATGPRVEETTSMTALTTAARAATDRRVEATTTMTALTTAAEQQQKQLQKETAVTE